MPLGLSLSLIHPTKQERMVFTAPAPIQIEAKQ